MILTYLPREVNIMTIKDWTDLITAAFSAGSLIVAIFALKRARSAATHAQGQSS